MVLHCWRQKVFQHSSIQSGINGNSVARRIFKELWANYILSDDLPHQIVHLSGCNCCWCTARGLSVAHIQQFCLLTKPIWWERHRSLSNCVWNLYFLLLFVGNKWHYQSQLSRTSPCWCSWTLLHIVDYTFNIFLCLDRTWYFGNSCVTYWSSFINMSNQAVYCWCRGQIPHFQISPS